MSDKPRPDDSGAGGRPAGEAERVVVRDRRKIDPTGHGRSGGSDAPESARSGPTGSRSTGSGSGSGSTEAGPDREAKAADEATKARPGAHAAAEPDGPDDDQPAETESRTAADGPADADRAAGTGQSDRAGDSGPAGDGKASGAGKASGDGAATGAGRVGAELEGLRAALEERTRDLQRVTAEYANYRKRVERDRGLAAEQTTGVVLAALLPVLDDLDRAREHGDLVGPFGSVAEQLTTALAKFGLTAFGEKGDPFDPTRHEAVAHLTSADVTEPTCVEVMRRGYSLGDRLLRPALVAVADPQ